MLEHTSEQRNLRRTGSIKRLHALKGQWSVIVSLAFLAQYGMVISEYR